MTTSALNKVCARPVLICWIVGALILDVIVLTVPSNGVRLISIASDLQGCVILMLAVIGATGLGFYVGMFACWFWIRPLCCKINGAPFKIGDHAVIMAGSLRGTVAEVEDITKGQGGQDVVWLDLGPERKKKFGNIFEEYSLMKIKKGGAPNSRPPSQLSSSPEVQPSDSLRPRVWTISVWDKYHPTAGVWERLQSQKIYPGPRDVFATDLHPEDWKAIQGIDTLASDSGHIVLRVAPGGKSFRVVIVDDTSESYRVTKVFGPYKSS